MNSFVFDKKKQLRVEPKYAFAKTLQKLLNNKMRGGTAGNHNGGRAQVKSFPQIILPG